MKLLGLSGLVIALLCTLCATLDGFDHCNFEQVGGQWYVLAFATNCNWTLQYMVMETTTANLSKLEDGKVKVVSSVSTEYGCLDVEMIYIKQDNGTYLYKSEWGDKIVERMKTDCTSYVITGARDLQAMDNDICKFVSLYARTMFVPRSVEQLFEDQAKEMEMEKDQIFYLAKKLACTEKD